MNKSSNTSFSVLTVATGTIQFAVLDGTTDDGDANDNAKYRFSFELKRSMENAYERISFNRIVSKGNISMKMHN